VSAILRRISCEKKGNGERNEIPRRHGKARAQAHPTEVYTRGKDFVENFREEDKMLAPLERKIFSW